MLIEEGSHGGYKGFDMPKVMLSPCVEHWRAALAQQRAVVEMIVERCS